MADTGWVGERLLAQRERIRELEAALRALTHVAPLDTGYAWGPDACAYCHGESWVLNEPGVYDHEPDCPWFRAKALVGEGEA